MFCSKLCNGTCCTSDVKIHVPLLLGLYASPANMHCLCSAPYSISMQMLGAFVSHSKFVATAVQQAGRGCVRAAYNSENNHNVKHIGCDSNTMPPRRRVHSRKTVNNRLPDTTKADYVSWRILLGRTTKTVNVPYPKDAKVTKASSLPGQSGNTTN